MSTQPDPAAAAPRPVGAGARGIDPRGPRLGAAVTATLLALALVLGQGPAGLGVLGLVVALFVTGAVRGPAGSALGVAYRRLVAPRLAPPTEREDPRPPRFAQVVGLVITSTGLVLALASVPGAFVVAVGAAFVAAFLNAAFGVCLGCELYLLGVRLRAARA